MSPKLDFWLKSFTNSMWKDTQIRIRSKYHFNSILVETSAQINVWMKCPRSIFGRKIIKFEFRSTCHSNSIFGQEFLQFNFWSKFFKLFIGILIEIKAQHDFWLKFHSNSNFSRKYTQTRFLIQISAQTSQSRFLVKISAQFTFWSKCLSKFLIDFWWKYETYSIFSFWSKCVSNFFVDFWSIYQLNTIFGRNIT